MLLLSCQDWSNRLGIKAMAYLSQILIYPIKSLDGVVVPSATVLASGALRGDREWAIADRQGQWVNGKRTPLVHGLRAQFATDGQTVTLTVPATGDRITSHLLGDRAPLGTWLSDYFGFAVQLLRNTDMGFPDDPVSPGPTVISTATLAAVSAWFAGEDGLDVEAARSRFRTNLEIADVPAFWEDHLFGAADTAPPFRIGEVELVGVNPCQRCIVPTRDALTGKPLSHFQKTFIAKRRETLPASVVAERFNHFYRLAVNTRAIAQAGKILRIGDIVELLSDSVPNPVPPPG